MRGAKTEWIEWTEGRHGTQVGTAGGFRLFTVGYGPTRSETMYYLETSLPVRGENIGQVHPTPTHAKLAAERVLRAFVQRIVPSTEEATR